MNESALQKIQQAADHLHEHDVQRCLNLLESTDTRTLSPEEKAQYQLVWVEAQLSLGNYDVDTALQHIVEYYKSSDDIAKFARAKYLKGWHLISIGQFIDAREPLLEAFLSLKRANISRGQGLILNRLSFIAQQIGEFRSAIEYLHQCIEIYHQANDLNNELSIYVNLGLLNTALGRLTDAIDTFDKARPNLSVMGSKNSCSFFMLNAVPYALKGDFSSAWRMMEKALGYSDGFKREQAIHFCYSAWFHNLQGNYDKALDALRQGLDISLKIAPESSLITQIKRLMADAHLAIGDHATARKLADEALASAEKLNERVEIASVHRVYAQLDAAAGNTQSAKEWFGKSNDMFSMIGAQYDLAATRYLAATTGIYTGGERQALLYLAREYFQREKVDHFVGKIDAEFAVVPQQRSQPRRRTSAMPVIVCRSAPMKQLVELAEHIASSDMSVLLTGATGTGKDLFARYIHHLSRRPGKFVAVNAAAIPNDMVESELFGYRRGAYTGAATTTSGWIEEAEGGTFYLNEIADSSPELQAKLLDVIEHRRICRLGDRQERQIDCRFIAATNHRLEELIDDGLFRLDLFHRLNEIPIHLPTLSERREDIEPLLEHFLKAAGVEIATASDRAAFDNLVKIFNVRPWQGNVRQLETEAKRLALICRGDISKMVDGAGTYQMSTKEETLAALQRTGWNRREVGRILGVSESTVRHRIKVFNLIEEK